MPDNSLARIKTWLATHAPRILHESLNPGASEAALASLEAVVGKPLPDDFKSLYRYFDGMDDAAEHTGSFFYGMRFLPLEEVKKSVEHRKPAPLAPLQKSGPDVGQANQLSPDWLTVGNDGAHTWLCVDLIPAESGRYGQVIFVDEEHETAFCVANSVAALLHDFTDDLEQGRYELDLDGLDEEDQFLLPDAAIDVVNWWQATRWQSAITL